MKITSDHLKAIGMAITVATAIATVVGSVVAGIRQDSLLMDAVDKAVDAKLNSTK